jgi:phosphoribosylglycinamide formyltransferase 2
VSLKVLLLGSGELGKEFAISMSRYGHQVIAVDRYPNAPAMAVSSASYVLDMLDCVFRRNRTPIPKLSEQ